MIASNMRLAEHGKSKKQHQLQTANDYRESEQIVVSDHNLVKDLQRQQHISDQQQIEHEIQSLQQINKHYRPLMIVNQKEQVLSNISKMPALSQHQQTEHHLYESTNSAAFNSNSSTPALNINKTMFQSHRLKPTTKGPPLKQTSRIFKTSRKISFQESSSSVGNFPAANFNESSKPHQNPSGVNESNNNDVHKMWKELEKTGSSAQLLSSNIAKLQ